MTMRTGDDNSQSFRQACTFTERTPKNEGRRSYPPMLTFTAKTREYIRSEFAQRG